MARSLCVRLRKRWLSAEKRAHKTLSQGKQAAHRKHEHASETIYEQAARAGCRWVN
jgi:hypothetical protein